MLKGRDMNGMGSGWPMRAQDADAAMSQAGKEHVYAENERLKKALLKSENKFFRYRKLVRLVFKKKSLTEKINTLDAGFKKSGAAAGYDDTEIFKERIAQLEAMVKEREDKILWLEAAAKEERIRLGETATRDHHLKRAESPALSGLRREQRSALFGGAAEASLAESEQEWAGGIARARDEIERIKNSIRRAEKTRCNGGGEHEVDHIDR